MKFYEQKLKKLRLSRKYLNNFLRVFKFQIIFRDESFLETSCALTVW